MNLNLIVAYDEIKLIGNKNRLPWRIKKDLVYFKNITMGKTLIMGRKTFDSLPVKLEGRDIIILTRDLNYKNNDSNTIVINSMFSLIEYIQNNGNKEFFVAGGMDIYKQFLNLVDRLYITEINNTFEGDAYFPEWYEDDFIEISRVKNNDDGLLYDFVVYNRK